MRERRGWAMRAAAMAAASSMFLTPSSCYHIPSPHLPGPSSLSYPRQICLHAKNFLLDSTRCKGKGRRAVAISCSNGDVHFYNEMLQKEVKRVIERFNLTEEEAVRIATQICDRKAAMYVQKPRQAEDEKEEEGMREGVNAREKEATPLSEEKALVLQSSSSSDSLATAVREEGSLIAPASACWR
eukprot:342043-Hanusia_phi.AAC.3